MKLHIFIICILNLLILRTTSTFKLNPDYLGIQSRIISGAPAALGQFPWQVILKKDAIDDLLCGGSIISNQWVLTAAHCTYGLNSIYLIFGTIELDDNNAISMTSTQLIIHPDYNNENLNNDVSLIKLPTLLQFSNGIKSIQLVSSTQSDNKFLGTTAFIAGFGLTDDEYLEYSKILLYAQVIVIDNSQCRAVFDPEVVISSTLCGKGANGSNQSICSGDSGGPLVMRDTNGNFIQIGINSFVAEDQCTEGFPSGYARLTAFLDFIGKTTGINN